MASKEITKEEVLSCLDIVIEEIDYTLGIVEGEERDRIEHAINTVETVVNTYLTTSGMKAHASLSDLITNKEE